MKNIAVMVSGGGTNLQALIDAQGRGEIVNGEISIVISSAPGVYALERAKNAGIHNCVLDRKNYPSSQAMTAALVEKLKEFSIDLVVMAGFMTIVTHELFEVYNNAVINIHPALIPSFCGKGFYGLGVHRAALDCGVKVTGATVHYVNAIPDGGRIIAQKAVDVLPGDTPETLQRRVMEQAEWILLPQAAEQVAAGIAEEKEKKL